MMIHSVDFERDMLPHELTSNAADAYERLRNEAISNPALLGDDPRLEPESPRYGQTC